MCSYYVIRCHILNTQVPTMDRQLQALNACHVELRRYLDPQTIIPNLNVMGLLTLDEEESLQNRTTTRQEKVDKIKDLLPTKGEGWWDKFIQCLKDTAQLETGHSTLLECLEDALVKLQQKGNLWL